MVSIAAVFAAAEEGVRVSAIRAHRTACVPAPSAASIMAGWREAIPSADSPVLAASVEEASAEASTVAEAVEAQVVSRGD